MRKIFKDNPPSGGFTLVELLMVIAVLAILVSLGILAMGNIRESSLSTKSMANLRQWGLALNLYVAENRGRIPYEGDRDNLSWSAARNVANESAWFNVLPPYVGAKPLNEFSTMEDRNFMSSESSLFKCPLAEFDDTPNPPVRFSYMMNSQLYHPGAPSKNSDNGNDPNPPVLITHLQNPSITAAFADVEDNLRARGRGRHVSDRHQGQANVVFMDGSVRRFDADYLRIDNQRFNGLLYTDNNKPDIIWNPWTGSHLNQ